MRSDTVRLILAIALSAAVLYVYSTYFAPKPAPPTPRDTSETPAGTSEEPPQPAAPVPPPIEAATSLSTPPGATAGADDTVIVETPLYTARLSRLGPSLTGVQLSTYRQSQNEDAPGVEAVTAPAGIPGFQFHWDPLPHPLPFSGPSGKIVISPGERRTLEFDWAGENGARVRLALDFSADSYETVARLLEASAPPPSPPPAFTLLAYAPTQPPEGDGRTHYHRPVAYLGGTVRRDWKDVQKTIDYEARRDLLWLGFESLYFLRAAWAEPSGATFGARQTAGTGLLYLSAPAAAEGGNRAIHLYVGPKERDRLKDYNNRLDQVIDFGWFEVIAIPFYWLLKLLFGWTGNWGIAIIIVTVLMRILLFPVNHMSFKSMRRMQAIQPLLTELRERHKDKPEELNRAMLEFYKTHKFNPLSGCLPMVAQIPIFVALYNVLGNAIELRHAPFYLWIHDLSAKDPYYVTPILMGVSMGVQQLLSPAPPDPRQKMMMYLMPVVFTFMFLSFPSGLVLYWLISNILGLIQQYFYRPSQQAR